MSSLPSVTGLIFTLIMLVSTSFYASRKVDQLINRKEVDVASTIQDSYYTDEDVFSSK